MATFCPPVVGPSIPVSDETNRRARSWLAWGIALWGLHLCLRILLAGMLPPLPKEAEFWHASRTMSLGYAAHPPLAFWLLRLGSAVIPDNPLLGHRLGALVLGSAIPWLIAWLCGLLFHDRRLVAGAFVLSLAVPLLSAVGILLLPDTPLVVFTLLYLGFLYRATEEGRTRDWLLAGTMLGGALLCKMMVLLPAGAGIAYLLSRREGRARLFTWGPLLGMGAALLIVSPLLLWNASHHWVSFRYQFWDRHQDDFGFSLWKLTEVLFEQLAAAGLLLPGMLAALALPVRRLPADWIKPFQFIRLQAWFTLGFFVVAGSMTETHPHWAILAYPPALLALACAAATVHGRFRVRLLQGLVALSLGLMALACLALPRAAAILQDQSPVAGSGHWARKLAKARDALLDWNGLARQLNVHLAGQAADEPGTVFTLDPPSACVVACSQHQGAVVDLAPLLRDRLRKADLADMGHAHGTCGLCVTSQARSVEDELHFFFQEVREVDGLATPGAAAGGKHFRVFAVKNLKADACARLAIAAGGVWAGLPRRSSLDLYGKQKSGASTMLVLAGWVGFIHADRPPLLEVRLDGRAVLRQAPSLERPDVSTKFYESRGGEGTPASRCGFELHVPLEQEDIRVQLVALTELGENILFDQQAKDISDSHNGE